MGNATLIDKSDNKLFGFYDATLQLDSGEIVEYKEHRDGPKIGDRAEYSVMMGCPCINFIKETR